MVALLIAVFLASLVGSLHCAGMCGGVVVLCVGGTPVGAAGRRWHLHAAYNGGRLVTYTVLGAVSGSVGAAMDFSGGAVGVQRAAAMVAGAAMILMGASALLAARGVSLRCWRLPQWLQQRFQRGLKFAGDRPPLFRSLMIGLLTGFLPCGWLYAFVITAAGTGSAVAGGLTMAVFWAGTVPVLLLVGVSLQAVLRPIRRHVPTLTALAILAIGTMTVLGRVTLPAMGQAAIAAPRPAAELAEAVRSIDQSSLPCCHDPQAESSAAEASP